METSWECVLIMFVIRLPRSSDSLNVGVVFLTTCF